MSPLNFSRGSGRHYSKVAYIHQQSPAWTLTHCQGRDTGVRRPRALWRLWWLYDVVVPLVMSIPSTHTLVTFHFLSELQRWLILIALLCNIFSGTQQVCFILYFLLR